MHSVTITNEAQDKKHTENTDMQPFTILRTTNDYLSDTHLTSEYMSLINNGNEYDVYFKMLFRYKNKGFMLDQIIDILIHKRVNNQPENLTDNIVYKQIVTFLNKHFFQET